MSSVRVIVMMVMMTGLVQHSNIVITSSRYIRFDNNIIISRCSLLLCFHSIHNWNDS